MDLPTVMRKVIALPWKQVRDPDETASVQSLLPTPGEIVCMRVSCLSLATSQGKLVKMVSLARKN